MKAVRFHEYGDPDVLRYEDVEQPVPGAGQVRVRVAATSFNAVDGGIRAGYMQGPFPVTLPHTPGIDVAGTVDALGEGVERRRGRRPGRRLPADGRRRRGRRVRRRAGRDPGAGPDEHPARRRRRAADGRPHRVAGALRRRELTAGQRVLINGAGGAVGGYAVQLAKRAGAHVIATASPRSRERVSAAGADEVIDHTATEVTAAVASRSTCCSTSRDRPRGAGRAGRPGPRRRRRRQHGPDDPGARRRGARRARRRRLRPQRRRAARAAGGAGRPRRAAHRRRPARPAGRTARGPRPGATPATLSGKVVVVIDNNN